MSGSGGGLAGIAEADRVASARLCAYVEAQCGVGTWISFDAFMGHALYAPELGYYQRAQPIFGAAGDFVTAPELSPLFAESLLTHIQPQPGAALLEFGAGSGQLAFDLLGACPDIASYSIVEISPALRSRQMERLAPFEGRVQWLEAMPDGFCGTVLANEVLDAMPVSRWCWSGERWQAQGVVLTPGAWQLALAPEGWVGGEAPLLEPAVLAPLPPGYVTENHAAGVKWLMALLGRLRAGRVFVIDYGYEEALYYHPERNQGTLSVFYRHQLHDDPLFLPGCQDVTAHVNFTALAAAAVQAGASVESYERQAPFLLAGGILEKLAARQALAARQGGRAGLLQTQAVQKLLSPAEMGEIIKVLVLEKPGTVNPQP